MAFALFDQHLQLLGSHCLVIVENFVHILFSENRELTPFEQLQIFGVYRKARNNLVELAHLSFGVSMQAVPQQLTGADHDGGELLQLLVIGGGGVVCEHGREDL